MREMSANNIESNGKSAVNMGQQPAQAAPVAAVFSAAGPWSTGLCGCFEETSNCKHNHQYSLEDTSSKPTIQYICELQMLFNRCMICS